MTAAKAPWSAVCPACKLYPGQEHRYDETCKAERPAAWRQEWRSWGVWAYLWPLGILAYFIDRRLSRRHTVRQ